MSRQDCQPAVIHRLSVCWDMTDIQVFALLKKGEKFALESRKGSGKVAKTHLTFTSNVGT